MRLLVLAFSFVFVAGCEDAQCPVPDDAWDTVIVDADAQYAGTIGFARDADGAAHIAYSAIDGVRYATNAGGSWRIEGPMGTSGQDVSLAVGADGAVHVVLYDGALYQLVYAVRRDGAWSALPVASGWDEGYGNSIAVDDAGGVHITYQGFDGDVNYMESPLFRPEAIGAAGLGTTTSVAIGPDGEPHVVFGGGGAIHAWREGGVWRTEVIEDDADAPRIAIAADGTLHVAYQWVYGIHHATSSGDGSWSIETLAHHYEHAPWIDLSADGALHVAYEDDLDACRDGIVRYMAPTRKPETIASPAWANYASAPVLDVTDTDLQVVYSGADGALYSAIRAR